MECVKDNLDHCSVETQYMAHHTLAHVMFIGKSICHKVMSEYPAYRAMQMAEDKKDDYDDKDDEKDDDDMRDEFDMYKMQEKMLEKLHSFMKGDGAKMVSDLSLDDKDDTLNAVMMLSAMGHEEDATYDEMQCVDPMKWREHGKCVPQAAFDCMRSVEQEMISPLMTRERLCM